ncbi:MAG: integrase [Clostridia bacterium]|nr:integrase [Clostridia bacterium]
MDLEEIKNLSFGELLNGLLLYLEAKSYTQLTLVNYRRVLRKIELFMIERDIDAYSPEVGMQYYETYLFEKELRTSRKKAILTALRRLNDFYSGIEYRLQQKHKINLLPSDYERALGMYATECSETGNKDITIESKKRFIRSFLRKCITFGCPDIKSLNASYITRACLAIENKDGFAVVRAFLKILGIKETTKADFSTLVPRHKRPIDIPTTYSEKEILRFERAINRTSDVGKRDYAMLLLATRLGMRSGDIAKLSLDEIDFEHEEICLIQQKNGEMLHLILLPEIRIALADYINNIRPRVASKTVFLRHKAPHHGITTSVLRFAASKYFGLADIDTSGKKHGPHAFRSSLASSMVNDNVPYEAVRSILGHSDPDAIKHYAKLNIEKLREFSIEVPEPTGSFKAFLDAGKQP